LKTFKNVVSVKKDVRMGVDETGSQSCPVAGFGISSVEISGSTTKVLVNFVFFFRLFILMKFV
jgi:hypothetical protein